MTINETDYELTHHSIDRVLLNISNCYYLTSFMSINLFVQLISFVIKKDLNKLRKLKLDTVIKIRWRVHIKLIRYLLERRSHKIFFAHSTIYSCMGTSIKKCLRLKKQLQ